MDERPIPARKLRWWRSWISLPPPRLIPVPRSLFPSPSISFRLTGLNSFRVAYDFRMPMKNQRHAK
jgi:hypothetical protein